jgi:hypothetical protein
VTPAEERLPGANLGAAVRVGDTVRRPRKPSSDAVQALLGHLRQAGFDGCPEPLGFDDGDREVVSYVEGDGGTMPLPAPAVTDAALVAHARLIRRFHDAVGSFPHRSLTWDPLLRDPVASHEIICHNDLSIPNSVYRGGRPSALVDWGFAAPGRRLWDVAYAVWWLVPLHRPQYMATIGWPEVDQGRRLRAFVDAYGLGDERALLLDVLGERQERNREQLRSWVADGTIAAYDDEDPTVECGRPQYVQSIRTRLESVLDMR